MAGFQTMEMPRPRFGNGAAVPSYVDIRLVRPVPLIDQPREINPATGFARVTPAIIQQIRELRTQGVSLRNIATRLEVSRRTVGDYARDIPPPASGWLKGYRKREIDIPKAQRMKRAGFSYREIGAEFNLGKTAVRRMLLEADGISDLIVGGKKTLHSRAMSHVTELTGLKRADLASNGKPGKPHGQHKISKARHLVFWLLHCRVGMNLAAVGRYLGGFDHTTVRHGINKVEAVAAALGVDLNGRKSTVFRTLWLQPWPSVGRL